MSMTAHLVRQTLLQTARNLSRKVSYEIRCTSCWPNVLNPQIIDQPFKKEFFVFLFVMYAASAIEVLYAHHTAVDVSADLSATQPSMHKLVFKIPTPPIVKLSCWA